VTGALVGGALGVVVGSVVTLAGVLTWVKARRCPDPEAHELTDDDREAMAADFALHTSAVRQQVSDYADLLADGDVQLRERLRYFEGGAW
jgi:hypothetical protein